jgi:hypothetical protein
VEFQRAAGSPGMQNHDLPVAEMGNALLRHISVTGGGNHDHNDVRALQDFLHVRAGKTDLSDAVRKRVVIFRDQLDGTRLSDSVDSFGTAVEKPDLKAPEGKVPRHGHPAVSGSENGEYRPWLFGHRECPFYGGGRGVDARGDVRRFIVKTGTVPGGFPISVSLCVRRRPDNARFGALC